MIRYPPYHGASTLCPGCGRSNWWIGISSAECAICGIALVLPPSNRPRRFDRIERTLLPSGHYFEKFSFFAPKENNDV